MFKFSEAAINRYISIAKEFSTWSKDPDKQVGAIAVGEYGQVLSQGYNGFPRNFDDSIDLYLNNTIKKNFIVHAEMNCIYHATLNGVSLQNTTLFVYGLHVCHECAKGIIQTGIKQVFSLSAYPISKSWQTSFIVTSELFSKSGIIYTKLC